MTKPTLDTAALPVLGTAIAAALGEGWQRLTEKGLMSRSEVTIHHPTGYEIRFSLTDSGTRVIAHGCFGSKLHTFVPRDSMGATSIGLSAGKTAAQIASELRRRLLPPYTEAYAIAQAARAAAVTRRASDLAIATELATLAKSKVEGSRYGQPIREDDFEANPVVWVNGTIATVSHGRISFERVTVGAPVAKLIVEALLKEPK